mmetsp:Transcript_13420/g.34106  ORF Transcript_13420/g.34106 Transcript_13420/m.34106 type:complete len:80 (-) Transcript_13420:13-252(-)
MSEPGLYFQYWWDSQEKSEKLFVTEFEQVYGKIEAILKRQEKKVPKEPFENEDEIWQRQEEEATEAWSRRGSNSGFFKS